MTQLVQSTKKSKPHTLNLPLTMKPCLECGNERPKGRSKFCSDSCRMLSSDKRKANRRPCIRCGGDKGYGHRGWRYCDTCRQELGPIWQELERERSRLKMDRTSRAKGRPRRIPKLRDDGHIWCARCADYRPPGRFGRWTDKPPANCRACQRLYNHEYRLRTIYGIDSDEYHRLNDLQGGRCAICLNRPVSSRLAVDHDHRTNAIRGLLCKRCNHDLLGSGHDSIELLERALEYLRHPPAQTGRAVAVHAGMTFQRSHRSEWPRTKAAS